VQKVAVARGDERRKMREKEVRLFFPFSKTTGKKITIPLQFWTTGKGTRRTGKSEGRGGKEEGPSPLPYY